MTQPLGYPRPPPRSAELVCDDGEPMDSARHRQQMQLLIDSLEYAWRDRTDYYAGGNMFLYFSEEQVRNNDFRGPDVFVVLGTTRKERRAWVVWEEDGKTPDVIIELLSESTERVDRGEKMRLYGRVLKVGEYFLFDPWSGVFEGYDLDGVRGTYAPKSPDEQGRLRCDQLGLLLGKARGTLSGVEADWLRWIDANGNVLPLPREVVDAEAQRADRAEAELNALKAKLARRE
jgi:Uma2 family endonuclease